jgi:hypothetical protein
MAQEFVVGLFQSKGIAEDACNRLRTEGVPDELVSLLVLHDIAPMPQVLSPAVEALSIGPMVIGDVRNTFAPFIHNGETVIFVAVESEADIEQAVYTIRQYSPVKISVVAAAEGAAISRDVF